MVQWKSINQIRILQTSYIQNNRPELVNFAIKNQIFSIDILTSTLINHITWEVIYRNVLNPVTYNILLLIIFVHFTVDTFLGASSLLVE